MVANDRIAFLFVYYEMATMQTRQFFVSLIDINENDKTTHFYKENLNTIDVEF